MLFDSSTEFSLYIETFAMENDIDLKDALLLYCEENYIDEYEIPSLINRSLKDKLEVEYQREGWLPKSASLEY